MRNKTPVVIGLGELLWDVLPDGKKMGGAPANFIYHICQAGIDGFVISSVGDDENGEELLHELKTKKLNTEYIGINKVKPTGTVTVDLDELGNPSYTIIEDVAWDCIEVTADNMNLMKLADAACFGSLAQRLDVSKDTIRQLLLNTTPDCIRVFDINLRKHYYSKEIISSSLEIANVLKINEDELQVLSELESIKGAEKDIMKSLLERYDLQLIALTRGGRDSMLYTSSEISIVDSPKVQVADTVGAGDSFTATLVAGLLKGMPIREIHEAAIELSAWVCTQSGATPVYNDALSKFRLFGATHNPQPI